MPRRPRLELPGIPLHITQRGVNRAAVFLDADDFAHYRSLLTETMVAHEVQVHAYVLMTNHIHLLVTASQAGGIARAMRLLNQRYVATFNRRHGRTGTLWEGRFKSCLVANDHYLLTVYRYIELNPLRAAMVTDPAGYRWSSVHANLGLAEDPCVSVHPLYVALGPDIVTRSNAYREWLYASVSEEDLIAVRLHLRQERALGDPRFQAMVEKTLNRPPIYRSRGRPPKS